MTTRRSRNQLRSPAPRKLPKRALIGVGAALASAPAAGTATIGGPSAASSSPPTTPTSAPTPRRSPPRSPGYLASVAVTDNAEVKAGDVIATHRRRRLPARGRDGARQRRDRAGDHRRASASRSQRRSPPSSRRRRSSPPPRRARPAPSWSSRASSRSPRTSLRAARRSSRRRPIATRPSPPCRGREAGVDRGGKPTLHVLKAQQQEAQRTLKQLQTALAKAERDLSFTVIRAPFDGVIGNRAVQSGDYVQPGQRLASLVPLARRLRRRQLQGDAARPPAARPDGDDLRSTRFPTATSRARSRASRRPRARCSRCCRPTTPPATSPRSCSACRCASRCRRRSPTQELLRPGMSVVVSVNTKARAPPMTAVATARPRRACSR